MNNIRVDIRLRPIRFGFLVRPDDEERIAEIFRINTCLWGGLFNPIIPFLESVPSWWERHALDSENAKQIMNGYLNFFEPDFLVEAEAGMANGLGFNCDRVLQFTDFLQISGEWDPEKYGLGVHDVYSALYQEIFRFETRHQPKIVSVEAKDPTYAEFVASNFGSFPIQEQFGYFERNYKEVFNPEHVILDSSTLINLYKFRHDTPLSMSRAKIQIDYHGHQEFRLFILNAKEATDLVDFWNLRATHNHVMAIPIQWINELSPFCKALILRVYRSQHDSPKKIPLSPISMFARSIPSEDIDEIYSSYLHVDEEEANMRQDWYPDIWRKQSESVFRTTRATLEADRKQLDIQINGTSPEIQFSSLIPAFAEKYGNRFRIANVVKIHDWGHTGRIATVFPCDHKNSPFFKSFKYGFPGEHFLPTTEGLVGFPDHGDRSQTWNLDPSTAFNKWLNANETPATTSDAGMATQQIIQTLEGFGGVGCLAHKGVIELLDRIANRPVTKTAEYQELRCDLKCALEDERLSEGVFRTLVAQKAVELGLELKCSKCGAWSWYAVNQLDYLLTCSFCFKHVGFPVTDPLNCKNSRWAYRVIGPFAQPDYAKGGYAAALAVRFLASVAGRTVRSEVTWSPGKEIKITPEKKLEADFILWQQRKEAFGLDYPTETVFGEAKSFVRKFNQHDVSQMKQLAETFPGSILVFAALKEDDDFSNKEIERLKKLAKWGREYDREREQSRAPVIVLTGTELFTEYSLEESWEEKGGMHKDLIRPARARTHNLRVLADLTQQLYLGMPSYDS